jgi:hypothetical protein
MCYSPKVKEEYVRKLYLLKQHNKKPMTRMVNEAIKKYLEREENERTLESNNKNIVSNTECN